MTQEIIEMAREAGMELYGLGKNRAKFVYHLEAFAKLVEEKATAIERHELQAKGEHPAPCARHCEANAFQIVIKNLKAQLAQPEQEPVAIDGNTSDGYHTFNELYEFRKAYNAALFNEWSAGGKCSVHKSWRHHDGELCFGGGWFIVVAVLPNGQISNHYEAKDWDLFNIPETECALFEFDGHTSTDVVTRLKAYAHPPQRTEQEPVAWINSEKRTFEWNGPVLWNTPTVAVLDKIPLYTHPPQREWQGLTDDEREEATGWSVEHIEAKLREKNT